MKKKQMPLLLISLFSILFILFFYHQIIFNPNNYLFSSNGDGLKNYFTFAYHVKHYQSITNFMGMNYPYGENIFYTDCHPLFTLAIFFFGLDAAPFIVNNSIAILNLCMILSIAVTFIVMYLLLLEFDINKWVSIIFSISITLLAPQIFRLGGHLSLSYSVAIPLAWLLTIKYIKSTNVKWLFFLFTTNLFWLFIHAYLGVIICFYILVFFVFNQLASSSFNKLKFIGNLLISVVIPFVIYYSVIKFTDTHAGRTENPSGFFSYYAELDDVFVPHHKPFAPLLNTLTNGSISLQWEAWSYVGLSTVLVLLGILIVLAITIFTKNKKIVKTIFFNSTLLNQSVLAAILVLLFAMAIPFIQFPELLNYLPFLKQFRALGRFTWPFYFVISVYVAYVLNNLYNQYKNKTLIVIVLFLAMINICEGIYYHIDVSEKIKNKNDVFNKNELPLVIKTALQKINQKDYQAILPLPFYHYGSENYSRPRYPNILKSSITISYQTGIPIFGASLTRLSIQESKNNIQLISPSFYQKQIIKDLKSDKPILIITSNEKLTNNETELLKKATPIFKNEELGLYAISINELKKDNSCDLYQAFIKNKANLFLKNSLYTSTKSNFLYYNNFEQCHNKISFRGNGALKTYKNERTSLALIKPNTLDVNRNYTTSFWIYNKTPDALNFYYKLFIDEVDEYENIVKQHSVLLEESENINESWSMIETDFSISDSKNRLKIYLYCNKNDKIESIIDDFIIYESGIDVYKYEQQSNRLFFNNHDVKVTQTCY